MSTKNLDSKGRFRARTIGFRVSPEEDQLINSAVALSGLTKQDYIVKRLLCRDVVVQGNPRVYKALKNIMQGISGSRFQIIMKQRIPTTSRMRTVKSGGDSVTSVGLQIWI